MSLTREIEQRLDRAGLIDHFGANQAAWQAPIVVNSLPLTEDA